MNATDTRDMRKAQTREKILAAGRELLLKEGFDAFSMRKLAAKVNYTATAIYVHFPDKEALLAELVELEFIQFRRAFDRTANIADPIERIRKMGLTFIEFALKRPDAFKFLFMNTQIDVFPKGHLIEQGNPAVDCYAYLKGTVTEALAADRFRPEFKDVDLLTQIFMLFDPVYLTEPLVKSTEFVRSPRDLPAGTWLWVCDPVVEIATREDGAVPAYLPGEHPFEEEFGRRHGIPAIATRGGAVTMYPEFQDVVKQAPKPAPLPPPTRGATRVTGPGQQQQGR